MEETTALSFSGIGGSGTSSGGSGGEAAPVEVFVQGIVAAAQLAALRERLEGLCDNSLDAAVPFECIERVYSAGSRRFGAPVFKGFDLTH